MKRIMFFLIILIALSVNGQKLVNMSEISLLKEINFRTELQTFLDARVILESNAYLSDGLFYEICNSNNKRFILDKRHSKWSVFTETKSITFTVDSVERIIGEITFVNGLDRPISEPLDYSQNYSQNVTFWENWMKN